MLWQDFEDMVRSLGMRLLGPGLSAFKPGPDQGRDARFEGKPERWPSLNSGVHGRYALQSKHTTKPAACCSDKDFKSSVRKEIKKVKALVASAELTHYMLFTNRTKSAQEDHAFRKTFSGIRGTETAWLIGGEEISHLLREHPDVWAKHEEEIREPIRFNQEDLAQIIHDFASFIETQRPTERRGTLKYLNLLEKNKLNNLSTEYFGDLQRHSMPQFEQIRSFLANPRHEEDLDLYRDMADEVRSRIRQLYSTGTITTMEEGFDQLRESFIATAPDLRRKRRWIRIFLDYMYANCDVGINVNPG